MGSAEAGTALSSAELDTPPEGRLRLRLHHGNSKVKDNNTNGDADRSKEEEI